MKTKILWALAALNACLAVALIGQSRSNAALAQQRNDNLRPGTYVALPGEVVGGKGNEVVYILDSSNHLLTAVVQEGNRINNLPAISLDKVFR